MWIDFTACTWSVERMDGCCLCTSKDTGHHFFLAQPNPLCQPPSCLQWNSSCIFEDTLEEVAGGRTKFVYNRSCLRTNSVDFSLCTTRLYVVLQVA